MVGEDTFWSLAPVLGPYQNQLAKLLYPTVHGGQCRAKRVTIEQLLHAAFVADTVQGVFLEPTCSISNIDRA